MSEAAEHSTEAWAILSRLCARSTLIAALVAVAGYWPMRVFFGAESSLAMLVGILIAWTGSLAALIPAAQTYSRGPRVFCFGVLAGLGVRFGLTLALALVLRSLEWVPATPMLVWVGALQLLLLATDTLALVRLAGGYSAEVRCLA